MPVIEMDQRRVNGPAGNEREHEQHSHESEGELSPWPSHIEPFREEMKHRYHCTRHHQGVITAHDDAGNCARKIGIAGGKLQGAPHIGGKAGWLRSEGEENCCPQPYRGIQDPDES